jgi:dihydroxyacetone kinase-like predicted kinase
VDVLDVLDAATVVRWSQAAAGWLDNRRAEIDQLNVFPVADGDTGTNLAVTVRAGADALTAADPVDAAAALGHFARGAVLGARGNSGVILAQFLRGIADAAIAEQLRSGQPECTTEALRAGFRLGAEQARAAVAAPVEGTILTVADAVADAVATGNDLRDLLARAVRAGERAVQLTTGQLAELDRAGVVDAGGQGLVVVLAALEHSAAGGLGTAPVAPSIAVARRPVTPRESGSDVYEFEVQYLLDALDDVVQ